MSGAAYWTLGTSTTPTAARPTRLHVDDHDFVNAEGERVFVKGHTDFLLYQRLLDREDIRPILAGRQRLGSNCAPSNCARVIGMVSSFSHWYPQEHPDYYDRIPELFEILDRFGMYGYFTVFADTQIVMPNKADQVRHFDRVKAQLETCPNSLGELVNEPYAHENATADPKAFDLTGEVPFSSGSYTDTYRDKPAPSWGAFYDFHAPRKDVKRVADMCFATNPNYQRGEACAHGEPDKFGGPNSKNPKVYLTNPKEARAMAGTARGTSCMLIYHTSAGVWSLPWNADELRCGEAWFGELR